MVSTTKSAGTFSNTSQNSCPTASNCEIFGVSTMNRSAADGKLNDKTYTFGAKSPSARDVFRRLNAVPSSEPLTVGRRRLNQIQRKFGKGAAPRHPPRCHLRSQCCSNNPCQNGQYLVATTFGVRLLPSSGTEKLPVHKKPLKIQPRTFRQLHWKVPQHSSVYWSKHSLQETPTTGNKPTDKVRLVDESTDNRYSKLVRRPATTNAPLVIESLEEREQRLSNRASFMIRHGQNSANPNAVPSQKAAFDHNALNYGVQHCFGPVPGGVKRRFPSKYGLYGRSCHSSAIQGEPFEKPVLDVLRNMHELLKEECANSITKKRAAPSARQESEKSKKRRIEMGFFSNGNNVSTPSRPQMSALVALQDLDLDPEINEQASLQDCVLAAPGSNDDLDEARRRLFPAPSGRNPFMSLPGQSRPVFVPSGRQIRPESHGYGERINNEQQQSPQRHEQQQQYHHHHHHHHHQYQYQEQQPLPITSLPPPSQQQEQHHRHHRHQQQTPPRPRLQHQQILFRTGSGCCQTCGRPFHRCWSCYEMFERRRRVQERVTRFVGNLQKFVHEQGARFIGRWPFRRPARQ